MDILVRAQVARWRVMIGATKPENLWGMVYVSDTEIDHYLAARIGPFEDDLPDTVLESVDIFWEMEKTSAARIAKRVAATGDDVDLRVERLRKRFGLSPAKLDVLLLCMLPELDLRYRRIFGYLQDDASRSSLTTDLLGQMVHANAATLEEKRRLFEPGSNLLKWRLVYHAPEMEGRAGRAIRIDERITSFLLGCDLGCDDIDARLQPAVRLLSGGDGLDQIPAPAATIQGLREFAAAVQPPCVVGLHGLAGSGRERAALAVSSSLNLGVLQFNLQQASPSGLSWDHFFHLVFREALLRNTAVYIDGIDRPQTDDRPGNLLRELLRIAEASPTLTFLATGSGGENPYAAELARYVRFDFPPPRHESRLAIWLARLPEKCVPDRETLAAKLASAFQLNEGQIIEAMQAAIALARRRSFANPEVTLADLSEACRRQSGRRLLGFARRIEPREKLTLDHVIAAEPNKQQLRELSHRIGLRLRDKQESMVAAHLFRSQGLLVLFAGPSGTGKTLAAEAIASEQKLDLYKIDSSAVMSKWVGETEKNLGRVFDEAEGSNAVLFLDECDSICGARSQISDAHDRWANLQTNYLLQRVEEYSGVVILATNLRQNIDEAFMRRIQVIVEFPPPDAQLRFSIWQRSLTPSAHELADADLRQIANRFNLSGGSIRNVAIESACRALARNRTQIELRDIIDSVAREYQKVARPITRGEFGEQFYAWAMADVIAPAPQLSG